MGAEPAQTVAKETPMKQAELKAHIERNLTAAGLPIEDVRVQPDTFSGWLVAVVSSGFIGMTWEKRRAIVLQGLEEEILQWLDVLTPEEREMAGNLPLDSDLEDIPMWPEALARARGVAEEPVIFPSDLDEDLSRPIVTSFYALRGGVGRSTALAYTARILASRGHSVLCVDMDLEASLARKMRSVQGRGLCRFCLHWTRAKSLISSSTLSDSPSLMSCIACQLASRMQITHGVCACLIRKVGIVKNGIPCVFC
jgi:hypothetical protein